MVRKHIPQNRLEDVYLLSNILHGKLTPEQFEHAMSNGVSPTTRKIAPSLYNKRQSDGEQGFWNVYHALAVDYTELTEWEDAVKTDAPPAQPPRPYQLRPLSYFKNRPKRQWAVEKLIYDRGTSLWIGDGGSGKSALVLNIMLARAYARQFIGRPTKRGFIVWCAAESADDIYPRVRGWLLHHGIPETDAPDIWFLDERVPFNNMAEVQAFIESMKAQAEEMHVSIDGFVFDTYARCTPGSDENSTQETKIIADSVLTISEAFSAHVATIHHMNARGTIRGNTALRDAVDTVWNVTKERDTMRLHCDKMRSSDEPDDFSVKMISQMLSEDDPDDTAPVIVGSRAETDEMITPGVQLQMLEILRMHVHLTCNSWQKHCEDVHDIPKATFHRHLKRIVNDELVIKPDTTKQGKSFYYTLSEKGAMILE